MPELLAPAGSAEGVAAAVQSGADAVYMSFDTLAARQAWELTEDEFGRAVQFAHVRGVKVYAVLDSSVTDETLPLILENARRASRMGADALIADDPGLIWCLRRILPSMPLHAGDRLCVHSLDGVRVCAAMGVSRVCLSRELSRDQLAAICEKSPIQLEIPVHGPLCPAFAGSCLLPGLKGPVGGPCPGLCREGFACDIRGRHPLAMKDLCLLDDLDFLSTLPIAALRIDGRERRPEYVAAVTGVYSRAVGTGRRPSEEDRELIQNAFPAAGFTAGYLRGSDMTTMLGLSERESRQDSPFYAAIRKNYLNREYQRVDVTFEAQLDLEGPLKLTARDDRGNEAYAEGGRSELAFHTEMTHTLLQTELFKTGGTPFKCAGVSSRIQKGIWLDPAQIAPVRDSVLEQLMEKRYTAQTRSESPLPELPHIPGRTDPPVLTVSVQKCSQLSARLLSLSPPVVYLPLEEAVSGDKRLEPFLADPNISVCAVLPPVIYDSELGRVTELMMKARQLGITEAAVGNLGHVIFAKRLGFEVRGDLGLRVRNSTSLAVLLNLRLRSAALTPELSAAKVRSIEKYMDTEILVYGRMPLMVTAGCLIRAQTGVCSCDSFNGFPDASGFLNPVTRGFGCRNTLWSAQKLHLVSRSREYLTSGLWGVRLNFTTENAQECVRIAERYLELGSYEPSSTTQGNY